jgi:hypothetical protein
MRTLLLGPRGSVLPVCGSRALLLALATTSVLLLGACGAEAPPGAAPDAGGGGAGGGDGAPWVCYRNCQAFIALGCAPESFLEDCVGECLELYAMAPACAAERTASLDCMTAERIDCATEPAACQEANRQWELCVNGGCLGVTCTGGEAMCACDGECKDQPVSVACAPAPEGGYACACLVDGVEVGGCQEPSLLCFPPESCCAPELGL